jgi:methyltransferase (TIGR00027 family)
MTDERTAVPDSTAVRTALWRAMHVQVDPPPHVLEDEIGLALAAPDEGWRNRQDMHPQWTRSFRAAMVSRARFIEDLVAEQVSRGVGQYVILGAGLDTFAQRRPELASRLRIFEVDRPGPQEWKRQRLVELGYGIPSSLRLVPVDFEAGASWWQRLVEAGFEASQPAIVASTGVTMYLTRDAIAATLRQVATLAPGSTFAMTFMLPIDLLEPEDRRISSGRRRARLPPGRPSPPPSRRRRCWRSRARRASKTPSTSREPLSPSATSPPGPMASGPRAVRTSWSPPRSGRRPLASMKLRW